MLPGPQHGYSDRQDGSRSLGLQESLQQWPGLGGMEENLYQSITEY